MSAKVSVIVNFHNSEKYIEECLNSIINQTYENLEIVLWDNCSTDKTYKVIKKFKDQRIKYFYNEKKESLYKASNNAILNSTGDLIAFLDSDDWWIKIILNLGQHFLNLPNMIFHIVIQIFFMKNKK